MFENAFDQWVAGSAGEKCTFIQVLHHTCQRYSPARKPEFINCQAKLLGGETVAANAANTANAKPPSPSSLLSPRSVTLPCQACCRRNAPQAGLIMRSDAW